MQTNLDWQKADRKLLGDGKVAYREWGKSRIINGYEKTLGSDEDVHYLDGGNGFAGVIYVKTYQTGYLKYV